MRPRMKLGEHQICGGVLWNAAQNVNFNEPTGYYSCANFHVWHLDECYCFALTHPSLALLQHLPRLLSFLPSLQICCPIFWQNWTEPRDRTFRLRLTLSFNFAPRSSGTNELSPRLKVRTEPRFGKREIRRCPLQQTAEKVDHAQGKYHIWECPTRIDANPTHETPLKSRMDRLQIVGVISGFRHAPKSGGNSNKEVLWLITVPFLNKTRNAPHNI